MRPRTHHAVPPSLAIAASTDKLALAGAAVLQLDLAIGSPLGPTMTW